MCGRFTLTPEPSEILTAFPDLALPEGVRRRYNVAPTDKILAVTARGGEKAMEMLTWGLIPSWAKDARMGASLINARADSVATKPAFRAAFRKRRCLVLADGFFEWRKDGARRRPFYFRLDDGAVFAFAGLWEVWKGADGYVLSAAIVTTDANATVGAVHDRMPVILPREAHDEWLAEGEDTERLQALLRPCPAERMTAWEVAPVVNSPRNDTAECVRPLGEPPRAEQLDLF